MRYFLVTCEGGQCGVKVPEGMALADVGYAEDVEAVEVPRLPNDHEYWNGDRWEVDHEAKAKEEVSVRAREMGRGGLLELIEALTERVAAIEAAQNATENGA